MTERKQAEEAPKGGEESFRYLVQNSSDVITLVGADGKVRYVSPAIERVLGYKPEERVGGTPFDLVHPDDAERARRLFEEGLRSPRVPLSIELRMRHKDGSWRHVEVTGTNLLGESGADAVVLNSRDVTARKEAEQRLREAEERYRMLVERVPAVVYIQEPTPKDEAPYRVAYMSPRVEEVLGYPSERFVSDPGLWDGLIHPEDLAAVTAEDKRTEETGEPFRMEYRMVAKDGSVVWVRDEAELIRTPQGEPLYWQGIMTDVTERKEAEERLRRLANAAFEGIVITDRGKILEANDVYAEMHGYERSELVGRSVLELVAPGHRTRVWENILAGYEEPYEVVDLRKDGTRFDAEVRGRAFVYRGRTVRLTAVRDTTERKAYERLLQYQALHDPLTGLPNRRLFSDRLEHALARSERTGKLVAVLFLDLDDFKRVNDSRGHEAGDRLLVAVAERLKRCLRPTDTVSRFGGDEFAVLLEEVEGLDEAAQVAERVLETLRAPVESGGEDEGEEVVPVTASIGLATAVHGRGEPPNLLREADAAMYQAKREGKARYKAPERDEDNR